MVTTALIIVLPVSALILAVLVAHTLKGLSWLDSESERHSTERMLELGMIADVKELKLPVVAKANLKKAA